MHEKKGGNLLSFGYFPHPPEVKKNPNHEIKESCYSRWSYIVRVCVAKIYPHYTGHPHYKKTGHYTGVYFVPNDFTRTILDTRIT